MNARFRAPIAVTAALSLALLTGGTAPVNASPATDSSKQLTSSAQKYYWKWSDRSNKTTRTFRESTYDGEASLLPHLVVTVAPAYPKHTIYLRFYEDGKWKLETKKKSNSNGIAVLSFNPWCNTAKTNWCDGTWKYKLSVGSKWQNFKITFSSK